MSAARFILFHSVTSTPDASQYLGFPLGVGFSSHTDANPTPKGDPPLVTRSAALAAASLRCTGAPSLPKAALNPRHPANGDFNAYWNHHLQQERLRNHPQSYDLAA